MTGDYEITVTSHSYANPSGRCVVCNGATPGAPACCDAPSPVPQDQSCPIEATCDTIMGVCLRTVGSTGLCPQNQQTIILPDFLSGSRNYNFSDSFFGLINPTLVQRSGPWMVSQHFSYPCYFTGDVSKTRTGLDQVSQP